MMNRLGQIWAPPKNQPAASIRGNPADRNHSRQTDRRGIMASGLGQIKIIRKWILAFSGDVFSQFPSFSPLGRCLLISNILFHIFFLILGVHPFRKFTLMIHHQRLDHMVQNSEQGTTDKQPSPRTIDPKQIFSRLSRPKTIIIEKLGFGKKKKNL